MQRHPCIFLWSHRSNLDNLVLSAAMQEQGLPPAHVFAGINMAFGPMGAILRRAGVIFIRRSTGDDPLYKYVLEEYVGYVLEKRFNLSWSIEGTRSRTGKMLPPRLGLLSYAADAYLQGRVDDIMLLPVSITFDQLHEITEYADYARGGQKKPEGFGWLYGFIKAQGARHYGKIYVRFGEPVSLAAFLGPAGGETATDPAARRLALQRPPLRWRGGSTRACRSRRRPRSPPSCWPCEARLLPSARSASAWPTRSATWRAGPCRERRACGRWPRPGRCSRRWTRCAREDS